MSKIPFVTKQDLDRENARCAMLQGLIPVEEYIKIKARLDEEERLALEEYLREADYRTTDEKVFAELDAEKKKAA